MWVSRQEWRRHCRELSEAKFRANAAEDWSRGLVNSILTSKGQSGVPLPVVPSEKHYTPSPVLPASVQGWTQEEFVEQLTLEGQTRAEALEAWSEAQKTGRFPYQREEEYVV